MTLHFFILINSVSLLILIALTALIIVKTQSDSSSGGKYCISILCSFSLWALFYIMECLSHDPQTKILMMKMQYFGVVGSLVGFAFICTQKFFGRAFKRFDIFIITAVAAAFLLSVWLNPGKLVFASYTTMAADGGHVVVHLTYGPFFYFWESLTVGGVLASIAMICWRMRKRHVLWRQTFLILISVFIPTITTTLYVFQILTLDWTSIALSITGTLLYICFLNFGLFDSMTYVRRNLLDALDEIIMVLKTDGTVDYINKEEIPILNSKREDFIGKELSQALPEITDADLLESEFEKSVSLSGHTPVDLRFQIIPLSDSRNLPLGKLLIVRNVTEINHVGKKLNYLLSHDEVTGLGNSSMLMDIMKQYEDSHTSGLTGTLLLACRIFNANLLSGMLSEEQRQQVDNCTSNHLLTLLPQGSTLVRYSRDEFYAFSSDVHMGLVEFRDLLARASAMELSLEGQPITLTFKIGVYTIEEGIDAPSAIHNVAFALNAALDNPWEMVKIYDKYMHLQHDLHRSLLGITNQPNFERDFTIEFQPVINVEESRVVGAEAYLRWMHPAIGKLFPTSFIPVFENTGHMMDVGRFILEKTFQTVCRWQDNLDPGFFVSINVSKGQVCDSNFTIEIEKLIKETGVNAKYLSFELKGSDVMSEYNKMISFSREIKRLGAMVSIDDFGGAKSSIFQIVRLGCNQIKIEPSMFKDYPQENSDLLHKIIFKLCGEIDCKVIGKCVETIDEFNAFRSKNINLLQGFIFSHSLPENRFWEECRNITHLGH